MHTFGTRPQQLKRCTASRPSSGRCQRRQVSAAFETPQQEQQQAADPAQQVRKLGRFSPKADIRRCLLNFHYEAEVDAGTLVVRPLSHTQLREVTDLLTDVFAASEDPIGLYTRYMRGQIRQYLENHLKVAPDAVVLVAVLLRRQRNSSAGSSGPSSAEARLSSEDSSGPPVADDQMRGSAATDATGTPAGPDAAADGAAQQLPQQRQQEVDDGVLVGTVEVSFTNATRTRFLTLNPPKDTAYLGNMCTAPGHRRRGYGTHLLRAAEQLTQLAAYPILYLHLRFKDTEAAAMYEQAGYSETARDMFLLPLLGIQRRFLMSRDMPRRRRS